MSDEEKEMIFKLKVDNYYTDSHFTYDNIYGKKPLKKNQNGQIL